MKPIIVLAHSNAPQNSAPVCFVLVFEVPEPDYYNQSFHQEKRELHAPLTLEGCWHIP